MADTLTAMPSGQDFYLPPVVRTWVDQSGTVRGTALRAKYLEHDVSGIAAWRRTTPLFQGVRTTALSVASATWTPVGLDTELVDTHAGHNDSGNTSRWYSPQSSGTSDWYLCVGHLPYAGAAGGVRIAGLRINGGGTIREGSKLTGTTAHGCSTWIVDLLPMTPGDYLELMGYQTSGAALNTATGGKSPSLTARWACAGSGTVVGLPAPRTWADGDVLSASSTTGGKIPLNVHVRDVVRWLAYPPTARITSEGTGQTIASGSTSWTSVQFTGETVDNYGGHDNATNNTRYTCQRDGLYYIAGLLSLQETAANSGYRACRLLHTKAAGGTSVYGGTSTTPVTNASIGTAITATGHIRMAAGDYVELQAQQTQGAALTVLGSANNCSRLIAVWRSL